MTDKQTQYLASLNLKNLATGIANQMRLNFQQVYRSRNEQAARNNILKCTQWVHRRAKKAGGLLDPMVKVAESIERHFKGILAHWTKRLTTSFMEGLNSVFSAVKRKARGYRSSVYMAAMLYFVADKSKLPAVSSH